ncbi:glycine cleavage T C-terminal barrel domain-containing protein, partial [Candidatus Palauibacter sp.]|uniref:glycine cleavage T C-terminal barrel domain-containing protein n=1 Tax=Candidatus Palauibacter sp. TaxID=3101350 RepID=UPI003B01E5BA
AHRPEDGALVVDGKRIAGFVCTTRHSETLGWQYGLALVEERLAERGRSLDLYESPGRRTVRSTATVVPPHFYDPKGQRLRIAPEGRPRRSGEASSPPAPAAHRRSPVRFDATPARTERRAGWNVVLDYESDRAPTDALRQACLIDLSHRARWDVQHRDIRTVRPFGLDVPPAPGEVAIRNGLMINRMNGTQASIWHVGPGAPPAMPDGPHYTDTTDSHCWLALLGDAVQEVLESVTDLDLFDPARARPCLTQGPVLHVPCQVVTWRENAVLIAFSRGYGLTFVEALLESGRHAGLHPAGERVFADWVRTSDG